MTQLPFTIEGGWKEMELSPVKDVCVPRDDILTKKQSLDRYAANLSQVVEGSAPTIYADAETFFSHTYPTNGLTITIKEVFKRLAEVDVGSPVIKLETGLGGGKTHSLIALYHIAKQAGKIESAKDLLKGMSIPKVKVATIVGTYLSFDAPEGSRRTLWGEIAYQLFGEKGYGIVKSADQNMRSPGEKMLIELFGDEKCLILLDELAIYLLRASGVSVGKTTLADITIAFLQELTQVASTLDNVSVVITSLDKNTVFKERTRELESALEKSVSEVKARQAVADADDVLSRIVRNLTPTKGEEFSSIIHFRLFESIDEKKAAKVCETYYEEMKKDGVKEYLPQYVREPAYLDALKSCYPFHPEFLQLLKTKTSSIVQFNKTRGVLRLLGQILHEVWKGDEDLILIGSSTIDFGNQEFVDELVKRLDKGEFLPAIDGDLFNKEGNARAWLVDNEFGDSLGTRIATTVFLHSITGIVGADVKRGVNEPEIALAVFEPGLDLERVHKAVQVLEETSFYLVKHGSIYAFDTEPNLNKIIHKYIRDVEGSATVIEELEDRIKKIYGGKKYFQPCVFANHPSKVADDTESPKLVIMHFNDCQAHRRMSKPPVEVREICNKQGSLGSPRVFSNNLVFLLVDDQEIEKMMVSATSYLALKRLMKDYNQSAPGLMNITKRQVEVIKEKLQKSELFLKIAVVVAYRHLFVPTHQASITDSKQYETGAMMEKPMRQMTMGVTESEAKSYHDQKKQQDEVIVEYLRSNNKARTRDDSPISPDYILDNIWPKNRDEMTGEEFRKEFYKNPQADLIFSNDLIMASMKSGIKENKWFALMEGKVYDKTDVNVPVGLTSNVSLVLVNSEKGKQVKKEFFCEKCGKKKTECVCEIREPSEDEGLEPGPEVGGPERKTIVSENAKLERIVVLLEAQLKDEKIAVIDRVDFKIDKRSGLVRLANALPQFQNADLRFNLHGIIDKEHEDGNFFEFRYRGDVKGYNAAKSAVVNYEGREEFNIADLVLEVRFKEPLSAEKLLELLGQKIAMYTQESLYEVKVYKYELEEEK